MYVIAVKKSQEFLLNVPRLFYIFFHYDAAVFTSTRRIFWTTTQWIRLRRRVDVCFRLRRTPGCMRKSNSKLFNALDSASDSVSCGMQQSGPDKPVHAMMLSNQHIQFLLTDDILDHKPLHWIGFGPFLSVCDGLGRVESLS